MEKSGQVKSFEELVRDLERQEFPEFETGNIYIPPENSEFHFAPSWHFKSGLLTQELVEDIKQNDKKVLSVGSGPAHLERFLVDKLGVRKDQIVLSDKEVIAPHGFVRYLFDMHSKWPDFGKKFDYVIFPESVKIDAQFMELIKEVTPNSIYSIYNLRKQIGLYLVIDRSLEVLRPNGQIRMNGICETENNIAVVNERMKINPPGAKLTYESDLVVVQN